MVTIYKDRFVVEVQCGTAAHEDYVCTMNEIIEAVQAQDDEMAIKNYYLLELLRQMLPNEQQARAMYNEIKDL